jgi:hypothetical protein
MSQFWEYLGSLLHLIGMLLFAGGHIWLGLLSAFAERQQHREGERFLAAVLPLIANGFGIGVLLLFGSGVLRLVLWGEPGLIFLPDLYGWILLSKLVLYMVIVGNGIVIERRYLRYLVSEGPGTTAVQARLAPVVAWSRVKTLARLNLLLILVVVALGQTLRFSRL